MVEGRRKKRGKKEVYCNVQRCENGYIRGRIRKVRLEDGKEKGIRLRNMEEKSE
jgi:hypothetical protein